MLKHVVTTLTLLYSLVRHIYIQALHFNSFFSYFVFCTVHFVNVNKRPTNQLSFNNILSFSLLHVSAFKMPSSGSLLRAFWDMCPVVEIRCVVDVRMLYLVSWYAENYWVKLTSLNRGLYSGGRCCRFWLLFVIDEQQPEGWTEEGIQVVVVGCCSS
jgi:hypothetical protein